MSKLSPEREPITFENGWGSPRQDTVLGLAEVMTKSAFGHEYALIRLKENLPFVQKEQILAQLEAHKKIYFWARERLAKVNPEKLEAIEEDLTKQKEAVLRENVTVH